jgi:hypothetical protein
MKNLPAYEDGTDRNLYMKNLPAYEDETASVPKLMR